jgi:3-oxoacyl-[acyl-carrier-protein] synthase I
MLYLARRVAVRSQGAEGREDCGEPIMSAVIGATHVLCAIGNGTDQVWASARAGIARIGNSHVMDKHFEPIQMGLVPEDGLGALTPEIDELPLPARARRILRLAAPSVQAVGKDVGQPVPLFIGLPALTRAEAPWIVHVPAYLQNLTEVPVDLQRSAIVPHGRAAGLMALELALRAIREDPSAIVIVGGVDSYLDLRLLGMLDREERILGERVMDGFIPGEGAAFFVVSAGAPPHHGGDTPVVVNGAASAMDPGHRYGDAPARGEGLATALDRVREGMPEPPGPIATTFAGFNGESFDAKLWGVARLRHNDLFSPGMLIEHPADKFGDVGAAMGAILVTLAAQALATGTRSGPALVWAASDREPRACAVLSRTPQRPN